MTIEYYKFDFECKWSDYDIAHGLAEPWMCYMPDVVGSIAVSIGLGFIIVTVYSFISYIRTNSQLPASNSENTLLSCVEE